MSLSDCITEAKQDALAAGVKKGLQSERARLARLDALVQQAYEIQALVSPRAEGEALVVLPFSNEKSTLLEVELEKLIQVQCPGLTRTENTLRGYRTYVVNEKEQSLPQQMELTACGLHFKLSFIREDIALKEERRGRKPQANLAAAENYMPTIQANEEFDVSLKADSNFKYNILRIPRELQGNFPGFKIDFALRYDADKMIQTHRTSAPLGSASGSNSGEYLTNMGQLYRNHPELRVTRTIRIKVIEQGKVYQITGYGGAPAITLPLPLTADSAAEPSRQQEKHQYSAAH